MGSSTNTTTTSSTLPAELTAGLSTAMNKSISAANLANPAAGMSEGTQAWGNHEQSQAAAYADAMRNYQAPRAYDQFQAPTVMGGYQPQQVGASNVTQFGSLSGAPGISTYMNPYTSSVIGTSLDELNRQLAKTNQGAAGQAASAGAFGGDRAAIVQSENARNANQIAAQTIAGLNNQGWNSASALAQQDASRALQAGTAQGQLNATVGEANQYAGLQGANLEAQQQRANQAAGLTTQALNAQQQRANQTADLNAANIGLSAGQLENQIGNTQQQTWQNYNQNQYNAAYRDAMYPVTSAQTLASQIGTLGGIYPRTTTTSTPVSTTGQIAGLATAGIGLDNLTGGSISSGIKGLFGGNSNGLQGNLDSASGNFTADSGQVYDAASGVMDNGSFFPGDSFFNARGGRIGFARGGQVRGYDDGGAVDDTYAPVSDDGSAVFNEYLKHKAMAGASTQDAQQGATQQQVDAALATNPTRLLGGSSYQGTGGPYDLSSWSKRALNKYSPASVPAPDRALVPAPDAATSFAPDAAAVPQPQQDNSGLVDRIFQQSLPPQNPQAGLAPAQSDPRGVPTPDAGAAQPDTPAPGLGAAAPARIDRSANPSSPLGGTAGAILTGGSASLEQPGTPMPQAGLAAPQQGQQQPQQAGLAPQPAFSPSAAMATSQPGKHGFDWGTYLLGAGLGMMASKSQNFLGAVGEGGLSGMNFVKNAQEARAGQMKNDMTEAMMPAQLAALNGTTGGATASDPGAAEVQRIRAAAQRAQILGDGRTFSTLNNQLLEIARDGRVTAPDGKVYAVPNAANLAFGHEANVEAGRGAGGLPSKIALNNVETGNRVAATDFEQQGAAAGAEPITTTVADANGNPMQVVIPRLAWRQQNLGNQSGIMSPAQYFQALKGRENPGGNPAQQNLMGSSATGDGQFIDGTWLSLFKQSYPDQANKLSESQILSLRANPQLSADMSIRYATQNAPVLQQAGIAPTAAALGLAHGFGPQGAIKIATAPANAPMSSLFAPDVVRMNGLQNKTAGQVAQQFASRYGTSPVALPGGSQAQQAGASQGSQTPPGLPNGTMASGVPVMTPEQKEQSEARGKQASAINEAGMKAPETLQRLDVIQNSMPFFRPGTTGNARSYATKAVTDLYQMAGLDPPQWAQDGATASDTISKEGGYLAAGMTRALGSREAMGVFNQIRAITPNLELSKGGFQVIVNSIRQGASRDQDLANYQEAWVADPRNKGSIAGMRQAFNQDHPIEAYASRVVPYPAPQDKAKLIPGVIYRAPNGRVGQWTGNTFQLVSAQ